MVLKMLYVTQLVLLACLVVGEGLLAGGVAGREDGLRRVCSSAFAVFRLQARAEVVFWWMVRMRRG